MHPDRFFEMLRIVHEELDDKNITSVSTFHNSDSVNEKPVVFLVKLTTIKIFVNLDTHGFFAMCFPSLDDNDNIELWVNDLLNH